MFTIYAIYIHLRCKTFRFLDSRISRAENDLDISRDFTTIRISTRTETTTEKRWENDPKLPSQQDLVEIDAFDATKLLTEESEQGGVAAY